MQILGQRDTRWKNKKLGWSNVTIGGYGCLITCLAMMADLLPDDVNERLKNVVGYTNLNLVIWDKIKEAIPSLEFEWRGWSFDNDKVLETIKNYGSCIVEVDFDGTPRTDDSHFVLFVGNKKLYDPWTGRECSTSKYSIIKGFVVIRPKGGNVSLQKQYDECREARDSHWNELKGAETMLDDAEEKIKELETTVSSQATNIANFSKENKILIQQLEDKTAESEKNNELRDKWHTLYQQSQVNFKDCKAENQVMRTKLAQIENTSFDSASTKDLIGEILRRIFGIDNPLSGA